jgi:hypothetical protein
VPKLSTVSPWPQLLTVQLTGQADLGYLPMAPWKPQVDHLPLACNAAASSTLHRTTGWTSSMAQKGWAGSVRMQCPGKVKGHGAQKSVPLLIG